MLTFTSPGYQPATFHLRSSVGKGTVIADVLLTGLVGVLVDGLTGAWYGLDPEAATVTLLKDGGNNGAADSIRLSIGSSPLGVNIGGASMNHPVRVTVREALSTAQR